jgi:hypothetical protein
VIVPNDSYARLAAERGGVPTERIAIVRNAPPGDRFRALAQGVEPPSDGSFRVGYLGVMGSQDGVELLIEALARSVRSAPGLDVHADLVGDGEARRGLEALADRLGIADRVTFHGYRPPEVFVPILAAAHVCVSPDPPTPFNDVSTMTKVVEYLAIGRPVVAFDLAETASVLGPRRHRRSRRHRRCARRDAGRARRRSPEARGADPPGVEPARRHRPALGALRRAAAGGLREGPWADGDHHGLMPLGPDGRRRRALPRVHRPRG